MLWFRIDNRMVHGQVIETWIPYLESSRLIVANDDIAGDSLQQSIMGLAVPHRVEMEFLHLDELHKALQNTDYPNTLVLLANCQDARRAYELGNVFKSINVGNLHYGPGKTQICPHAALSEDDAGCLHFLREKGVELDFRCVPNDKTRVGSF
ncbi:MAG: PTS sugar transporter subunit IIB [Desulfovibrionaceae bacterium]|nr:PTS sugar transporter subunit IIB [Desulfovibrionaceae bacterium]